MESPRRPTFSARLHCLRFAARGGRSLLLMLVVMAGALLVIVPTAGAAPSYRGVQLHSLWHDTYADLDRELDTTRDLGANVVRIDIGWATLEENRKGGYVTWYRDRIDNFINKAAERNIKVIAMIHQTPCWASSAPSSIKLGCRAGWWGRGVVSYPPTRASDYADIVRYIAARYRTKLAAIEVWNEPNHSGFLKAADPAKSYAALVRAAHPAIKSVAPGVRVLAGALAQADAPFLEKLYANGIKGYYDVLSVHPYNGDGTAPPDTKVDPSMHRYTFADGLRLMRTVQAAAGDSSPVWITEFGWHTGSTRDIQDAPWANGVSEQTQADYLAQAVGMLRDPTSGLGFVDAAVVYNLRDRGTDATNPEHNFGLVRRDFSQKPSFAAVKQAFAF